MTCFRAPLLLASVAALAGCDQGISFDKAARCDDCAPGHATRGVVMYAGLYPVTSALRGDGRLVVTRNGEWVELDASFRPRAGRNADSTIAATAAGAEDTVAFYLPFSERIELVDADGTTASTIPAIDLTVDELFFAGDALVLVGAAFPGGSLAGAELPEGRFFAVVDATDGTLLEVRHDVLATEGAPIAPGASDGAVLVALPGAAIASLGITTPTPSDGGFGVVRHDAGGTESLAVWVASTSVVGITAVASAPDGSVAIGGRSTADAFTIQQVDPGVATDRAFVAVVNQNGTLRWTHALDPLEPVVDGVVVSPVDASLYVTGAAGARAYVGRVDAGGLAWTTGIEGVRPPASRELVGVNDAGNVLVGIVVVPEGDGDLSADTTVTIAGDAVITSNGYGLFELVR